MNTTKCLAPVPSAATTSHPLPPWAVTAGQQLHDIQALVSAMPQGPLGAPSRGAPDHLVAVHYTDGVSRPVSGEPLPVVCAIDGIQRCKVLTYRPSNDGRGSRPVVLAYQAAGAINLANHRTNPLIAESLSIICSWIDEAWVRSLPSTVPVTVLDEHEPSAVAAAAWATIHGRRQQLERYAVANAPVASGGFLLLDGSLIQAPPRPDLVAVVKSVKARWTTDPTYTNLPGGWRSPGLHLRGLNRGQVDRYTAYVKLTDTGTSLPTQASLIRVEVTNPELIDPLAAYARACRIPRHPRPGQLAPIEMVEKVLNAHAPNVFQYTGT